MTTFTDQHAPVALFAYERLEHLKKTVAALQENYGAAETELYIFSDGARHHNVDRVTNVRHYLRSLNGFKRITIFERDHNMGLAANIKAGISHVFVTHDRIIVLEDDIVTAPNFLLYMNAALRSYAQNDKVGHINGWSYPLAEKSSEEFYFLDIMNCWGWATWKDTWSIFNDNPMYWANAMSHVEKNKIDLNGSGEFWPQVQSNIRGKKNTWAIFWYLSLIENDLYSLTPRTSFCQNIGHDGSGENCKATQQYSVNCINEISDFRFPDSPNLDKNMRQSIELLIKRRNPILKRIAKKLRSLAY